MQGRQVTCPDCGRRLLIPPEALNRMVRCGKCTHKFRAPAAQVNEEDIQDWLSVKLDDDEEATIMVRPAFDTNAPALSGGLQGALAVAAPEPLDEGSLQAGQKIRLVRIDDHGVLFEFPASRLLETSFRCSMPRMCLRCGAQSHLEAHVLVYAQKLLSGVDVEAEHAAGAMKLTDQEAHNLSPEELLSRLPRVPNIPHPGDLPMPYWLCDMCTTGNVISAELQVDSAGNGRGRLLILHVRRAEQFMANAGGEGQGDFVKLHEMAAGMVENPWDHLPQFVQDRLRQWWRARRNERFLGYVSDRDHVRTEDGVAGIVITADRVIYHTRARHYECSAAEPMELQLAMGGKTGVVRINTASWKLKHMTVDRDGVSRLRNCLTTGKFHVVWH